MFSRSLKHISDSVRSIESSTELKINPNPVVAISDTFKELKSYLFKLSY